MKNKLAEIFYYIGLLSVVGIIACLASSQITGFFIAFGILILCVIYMIVILIVQANKN
jgi:hypothetical protein